MLLYDLKDKESAFNTWEELLKQNPDAKSPDGRPLIELTNKPGSNNLQIKIRLDQPGDSRRKKRLTCRQICRNNADYVYT